MQGNQSNALQLYEAFPGATDIPVGLGGYRLGEESDGGGFLWESPAYKKAGEGCELEYRLQLRYILPKDAGWLQRMFGRKPQEMKQKDAISLNIRLRNLAGDPDLLRAATFNGLYFTGSMLFHYNGEDMKWDLMQWLDGNMLLATMVRIGDSSAFGGGLPQILSSPDNETKAGLEFRDFLRKVVPRLRHETTEYSIQLGGELTQKELECFQRHTALVREFLGMEKPEDIKRNDSAASLPEPGGLYME